MKNYLLNFASANSTLVTGLQPTMVLFAVANTGATLVAPGISEIVAGFGLYSFQWGTTTPIAFMCDGATSGLGSFRYIKGMLDPADRADEYGNTITALGNSNIALGNSDIALGNSSIAQGLSIFALGTTIYAYEQLLGSTLLGIGNTSIALGITNVALGISTIAQGNSTIALGTTNVAIGTSMIAQGNTIIADLGNIGVSLSALSISLPVLGSTLSSIGGSAGDPVDLFGYVKRIAELIQGQEQFVKTSGALTMYDRTGATLLNSRTISNNSSMVIKS